MIMGMEDYHNQQTWERCIVLCKVRETYLVDPTGLDKGMETTTTSRLGKGV
jgi:hypothetical protein